MTMVKNSVLDARYITQFHDLSNRLSPENLTCDGELSTSEWKMKEKRLLKDWKRLERQVGRTVTEEEIFEAVYPQYFNRQYNELPEALASQVMRGE